MQPLVCRRCHQQHQAHHFIGANGCPVKTCAACRNVPLPENPPPPGLAFDGAAIAAPPPVPVLEDAVVAGPHLAPVPEAAAVAEPRPDPVQEPVAAADPRPQPLPIPPAPPALDPRYVSRDVFEAATGQFNDRFDHLLGLLQQQRDAPPDAANGPRDGEPRRGEFFPPSTIKRPFAWVSRETLDLIARDQLRPEQLVRLRNPASLVTRETTETDGSTGAESALAKDSAFIRAVPSIAALTQLWVTYIGIKANLDTDPALIKALCAHLETLVEYDATFTYRAVAEYHLGVCRQYFGTSATTEWADVDQNIARRTLDPHRKAPAPSIRPAQSPKEHTTSYPPKTARTC